MVEVLEMNEVVGDQMIEVLSYLYEGCSSSENDQMIGVSSYLYEDCLSLDDDFSSNQFEECQMFLIRTDDQWYHAYHTEDFFQV